MIYLDTSVLLAHLLAEERVPPDWIWRETLISSRLLQYELWTRIHARKDADSVYEAAHAALARIAFVELSPVVLERVEMPFPVSVRTLDALHLATIVFLRRLGQDVKLASYDRRLCEAAAAMGIPLADL